MPPSMVQYNGPLNDMIFRVYMHIRIIRNGMLLFKFAFAKIAYKSSSQSLFSFFYYELLTWYKRCALWY